MKYVLSCILMLSVLSMQAQPQSGNGNGRAHSSEKFEAQKVAFLTQKLQLTPKEAQEFWPLYNEFQDQKKSLRSELVKFKNLEKGNDQGAKEAIDGYLAIMQKELDLQKKYLLQFQDVLPSEKVFKLIKLERKFKEDVLNRMKKRNEKTGSKRDH